MVIPDFCKTGLKVVGVTLLLASQLLSAQLPAHADVTTFRNGKQIVPVEKTLEIVERKPIVEKTAEERPVEKRLVSIESLSKLPEVYTHETPAENIREYRESISRLPEDAQCWILSMGQFLENKKFEPVEKRLIGVLASKKDPLIYLTHPRIIDGASEGDVSWISVYNPAKGAYMCLDENIRKLRTKGLISERALQELEKIVKKAKEDYEVRKGLYLIKNFGRPDQRTFSYRVPSFNTQLYMLGRLLEMGVPEGYERLAVAAALDYGSVYTIGDNNVRELVVGYAHDMIKFIAENDSLFKEKGWQAKDYPLEADIGLVWGATGPYYPFGEMKRRAYSGWDHVFRDIKLNISDFNWLFVSMNTLKEMRLWMVNNHIKVRDTSLIDADYKAYCREHFPGCYDEGIDEFMAYLGDCIYTSPKSLFERLDREDIKITVDGRGVLPGNIMNMNWQWRRFIERGKFLGGCGDDSYVESMLTKSVNIAAVPGEIRYLYKDRQHGHSFCCYFNPHNTSWKTNVYNSWGIKVHNRDTCPKILIFGWSRTYWDNVSREEYLKYPFDISPNWWRGYPLCYTHNSNLYAVGIPSGYIFRKMGMGP